MRTELQNPYWVEVQTFPNSDLRWNKDTFEPDCYPGILGRYGEERDEKRTRHHLVRRYSWSIPTDDEIFWLAEQVAGQRIVEVGAGTGYWAWLLYQAGVNVIAYDKTPVGTELNSYFAEDAKLFYPVLQGEGPDVAVHFPQDVLMMCWPNYSDPFANDTLQAFRGDTFIFKGEGDGGCTGDDDFFRQLDRDWVSVDRCPYSVQWSGMHDYLWIYRRTSVIQEQP